MRAPWDRGRGPCSCRPIGREQRGLLLACQPLRCYHPWRQLRHCHLRRFGLPPIHQTVWVEFVGAAIRQEGAGANLGIAPTRLS